MMDPSFIFSKAGELMLLTCADSLATVLSCLQQPEQLWYVGCEKHSASFENSLPSLEEVSAKQSRFQLCKST